MAWDQAERASDPDRPLLHTWIPGAEGWARELGAGIRRRLGDSNGSAACARIPERLFRSGSNVPRLIGGTRAWSATPYALDTITWGDQWEITRGSALGFFRLALSRDTIFCNIAGTLTGLDDVPRTDTFLRYRGAIVFKPVTNGGVFADIGTSFDPSAETLSQITSGRSLAISNADFGTEEIARLNLEPSRICSATRFR